MKRFSPLFVAILFLTGCHAPMPSINLLAPYGSTRIPPPGTSSVAPSQYYPRGQQSSGSPVGTGFRERKASTSLSANDVSNGSGIRLASGLADTGTVELASHETTTIVPTTLVPSRTVVNSPGPVQIVDSGAPRILPANVRGMHINEVQVEPTRFFPTVQAVDIMELPPASASRYANVVPVNQAIGTSVAQASTRSQSTTSGGSGGWQSRD